VEKPDMRLQSVKFTTHMHIPCLREFLQARCTPLYPTSNIRTLKEAQQKHIITTE